MEYLKPNHGLKGRDIIPVVMALAAIDEDMAVEDFATLKEKYPLRSYSSEDLASEFLKLTGYPIGVSAY